MLKNRAHNPTAQVSSFSYGCSASQSYRDEEMFVYNKVPTCEFVNVEDYSADSSFDRCLNDASLDTHGAAEVAMSTAADTLTHPLQHIASRGTGREIPPIATGLRRGLHLQKHNSTASTLFSQHCSEHQVLATRAERGVLGDSLNSKIYRKFDGDPLAFESWQIRIYQEIVAKKVLVSEALEYIIDQTTGEARDLAVRIASVEFVASWKVILEIFEELRKQFAADHLIRKAIDSEIKKFPQVTEDVLSLNKFVNLCRKIELHKSVCRDLLGFDQSNGSEALRAKLPRSVQEYYGQMWYQYENRFGSPPPFSFFISVIKNYKDKKISSRYAPVGLPKEERRAVRLTETNAEESAKRIPQVTEDKKSTPTKEPKTALISPASTTDKHPGRNDQNSKKNTGNIGPFCSIHKGKGHSTSRCHEFLKWSPKQRRDFAVTNKLCFNCLGLYHKSDNCYSDKMCNLCGARHHMLLCMMKEAKPREAKVNCTTVCNDSQKSSYCTKVLLVDISLDSRPDHTLRAYAILDEQSDTTIVDERVADYFGGEYPTRVISTSFVTSKAKFKHKARCLPKLRITGVGCKNYEVLNNALTYPSVHSNKNQVATPEVFNRFRHTSRYAHRVPELDESADVLILVGLDNAELHKSVRLTEEAPYVHRTPLGLALVGKVCSKSEDDNSAIVLRTQTTIYMYNSPLEEVELPRIKSEFPTSLVREFDVLERRPDDELQGWSGEDHAFLHMMSAGESVSESGELTYPLPLIKDFDLPSNRDVIYRRTCGTLRSISKSVDKLDAVTKIMDEDIRAGHVEELKGESRIHGGEWYLPPFVVTHKRKGTPRLVFDAAAEYETVSLNKLLLQGPDMLNRLKHILLRFRERKVAVSGDIKGMFQNFKVNVEHRQYLRFFWWKENDPTKPLVAYQINTHAFGLKSSPSVANFALRSIADKIDDSSEAGQKVSNSLCSNFYVDDLLTSTNTPEEASELVTGLTDNLSRYGIKLHKFASNHPQALSNVPSDYLTPCMKRLPEESGDHSALGINWDPVQDTLSLSLNLPQKEYTRRGVLSVIGSLYDPMGYISPIILEGRLFQREALTNPSDNTTTSLWDQPLPEELYGRWDSWRKSLHGLDKLILPRCLYPVDITPVKHHICAFADASEAAMGYALYLLTLDSAGKKHLGFICGNSRIAPKNSNTIPRMELNAAVLAARAVNEV